MRIISGRLRHRKLLTSPGQTTRPITDRVKETLFESIQQRITGTRVADVFAGTGVLGLEALSRGAQRVTFVEKDKVALELLRKNVDALECHAETLIWPSDVFRCSFRPKGKKAPGFAPFGLIFFDPPYALVPKMKQGTPLWLALTRLARPDVCESSGSLVLRVPDRAEFDLPPAWNVDWTLKISHMLIHVCTRTDTPAAEDLETVE